MRAKTDEYLLEVAKAVVSVANDRSLNEEAQKAVALRLMRKAWKRGRVDLHLDQISNRMARAERRYRRGYTLGEAVGFAMQHMRNMAEQFGQGVAQIEAGMVDGAEARLNR